VITDVRLETEAALTRGIGLRPIPVHGARMPHAGELPPSPAGPVRRQARQLSPNHLCSGTGRPLRALDRTLAKVPARQRSPAAENSAAIGGTPMVRGAEAARTGAAHRGVQPVA